MAAPPLLSTMSVTIISQAASDNFVSIPAAGLSKTEEADFQEKFSASPCKLLMSEGSSSTITPQGVHTGGQIEKTACDKADEECNLYEQHRYKLLSDEEISGRKALIVVDGNIYDVAEFLETHPGGAELILQHLNSESLQDAGRLMRGMVEKDGHSHSEAAFRMLDQFFVGSVKSAAGAVQFQAREEKKYRYNVDLTKPIVAQVGYLGSDYDQWVHDPITSREGPRFFQSDVCEFFTKTKWWVIPLVWVPVAFAMFYVSIVIEKVPLSRIPGLCVLGASVWTLLEYLLHRFLFHMKTCSYWGNTLHYILHGFHHKHPMDGARLVFPPAFTAVICLAIWVGFGSWFASYPNKLAMYAAGLLAYVVYDLTHYFLHFGTAFNDGSRNMKRYHLNHHFKDQTNGYGITTTLWDTLFGTRPASKLSTD